MKNSTTKLMIAAALMAVAAGAASAQTLKADVPFAFRTANGTLGAGTYTISMDKVNRIVLIQSRTESAMLLPTTRLDGVKAGDAKLVFSCGVSHCTLVQVWSGNGNAAYEFHSSKPDRDGDATQASLVEIRLHSDAE